MRYPGILASSVRCDFSGRDSVPFFAAAGFQAEIGCIQDQAFALTTERRKPFTCLHKERNAMANRCASITGMVQLTQGTHYNYTSAGHRLILSVLRPSAEEVAALRSGDASFGLYVEEAVIFFLCRIGCRPWCAGHYNWWINPPEIRPDPLKEIGCGAIPVRLSVEMVNAADGRMVAKNDFALPRRAALLIRNFVLGQIETMLDPWDHLESAGRILNRSQNLSWMVDEAIWVARCRPLDDESTDAANPFCCMGHS